MKQHSKALLWLFCLAFFLPNLYAQSEYQKMVSGLGHSGGESILHNGSIRYGGYTNAGVQEPVLKKSFSVAHPSIANTSCSGTVYYVWDMQSNLIYFYGKISNFPWDASQPLRNWTPTSLADIQSIENHSFFIANAIAYPGHDYDLTAYEATPDLNLSNQRIFGDAECQEQMGFWYRDKYHWSMEAANSNNAFYVGATNQCIYGGASDMAVAKVDVTHQVIWSSVVGKSSGNDRLMQILDQSNNEVLAMGTQGWHTNVFHWIDDQNGNHVRSREYDLVPQDGSQRTSPFWSYAIEDDASNSTDLFLTGYSVQPPSDPSTTLLDVAFTFMRLDNQGVEEAHSFYREANGLRLFTNKIYQLNNTNEFLITGRRENFDTDQFDGVLIKVNRDGVVQWSKTIGFGSDNETYGVHQLSNGDFWVLGNTNAFVTTPADRYFFMAKFDQAGNYLEAKYYIKDREDAPKSLLSAANGDFFLEGYQFPGLQRYYIRTSPNATGPLCHTVPHAPLVQNLQLTPVDATIVTESPNDIVVTHPLYDEQSFNYTIQDAGCPDCNCNQ